MSLFGSLLAMALLGTLVLGVVVWLEERSLEERARVAGTHMETLAHAVSSYVNSDFPDLLADVGVGPQTVSFSDLSDVLPAGFSETDALGRQLRVMALSPSAGVIDVLVAQTLRAGDTLVPSVALLGERYGGVRMGVVPPEAPTRLQGPAIDEDVTAFQGAFAGVPAVGALAVLARFDHESVFGDQLYRVPIPGYPEGNVMETALDLGGNDIVDAKLIEAQSFDVTEDIEAGGELIVRGALTVGQAVEVTGPVNVVGAMTANSGLFTGTVVADTVKANDSMETDRLTATGTVTAATVAAAKEASADTVMARGNIRSSTAFISRLTVGSCSGC